MSRFPRSLWLLVIVCLLLGAAAFSGMGGQVRPVSATGVLAAPDAVIDEEYGSTRAQDGRGNNSTVGDSFACNLDANRGNIMDFHAYNDEVGNIWQFAWSVDSSQALDATSGNFFGNPATRQVNYFVGIDVGCNGGPGTDMNATGIAGPWTRFFGWQGSGGVDFFVASYPTGANTLQAQLWTMNGTSKTFISDLPSATRVTDFRRHIEVALDGANVPSQLKSNTQLCLMVVTTENVDDRDGNGGTNDGGRVLDALGATDDLDGCNLNYRLGGTANPLPNLIDTRAFCQETGRSTLATGNGPRQCLSNPVRETINALDNNAACEANLTGVDIDGNVSGGNESPYVYLTEGNHAAPYILLSGGGTTDFAGESSAYQFYDPGLQTTNGTADVVHGNAGTDSCFLYLEVEGVSAIGANDNDLADDANLYIAIDRQNINSATDTGSFGAPGSGSLFAPEGANSAQGAKVNFKGWTPDYSVAIWNRGFAGLYQHAGGTAWNLLNAESVSAANTGVLYDYADCPNLAASDMLFGFDSGIGGTGAEVAIPWAAIGGLPASNEAIKIGMYTVYDGATGGSVSSYDVFDQAPGVGQGCQGRGCHERIGDEPNDADADNLSGTLIDGSPYVGRHYGDSGDAPASDPYSSDTDTIEEYFIFTPHSKLTQCYDYGDNPDLAAGTATGDYQTLRNDNGPRHRVQIGVSPQGRPASPWMGVGVDVEPNADGQPNATASGDDANGFDDHDGVNFDGVYGLNMGASNSPIYLAACETVTVDIPSGNAPTGGGNAYISGWVDFNDNGSFLDGGEQIMTNVLVADGTSGGSYSVTFGVPCNAALSDLGDPADNYYARFRISTTQNLNPTTTAADLAASNGWAPTGEVEDYAFKVVGWDFGDLPDGPYETLVAAAPGQNPTGDGARHLLSSGLTLGASVDAELGTAATWSSGTGPQGLASADSLGDDTNGSDDENGVVFTNLVAGGLAVCSTVSVDMTGVVPGGQTGLLNAWIDWNGDGSFGAGEQIAADLSYSGGPSTQTITVNVPCDQTIVGNNVGLRFRFSTVAGLGSTGVARDGEVEDYLLPVYGWDFGDHTEHGSAETDIAAGLNYVTTVGQGARHLLTTNLRLGASVDAETNGNPAGEALADDAANDDENGVTRVGVWDNTSASLNIDVQGDPTGALLTVYYAISTANGAPGTYGAWFAAAVDQAAGAGLNMVTFDPDGDPFNGPSNVCFKIRTRITTQAGVGLNGYAPNGEVEDDRFCLTPLAISLSSLAAQSEGRAWPVLLIGAAGSLSLIGLALARRRRDA